VPRRKNDMKDVEVNGVKLVYVEAGGGEPVVFVHGSLEDLRVWRRQVEQFAASHHVVAYSRRYHHPNAAPAAGDPPYTAGLHAADLAGLIETLDLAPAHVVCSSFGGCVALALAVARPELVRSLVLAEPPLLPCLEHVPGGAAVAAAFYEDAWHPAQLAFRDSDPERGIRFFLDAVAGEGAFDRLSPSGRRMILDNAAEMQAETESSDIFPATTRADVANLDRPVLLLNGELSPRLFHLINADLAHCLPRAMQAVIPHASHVIHVGNPAAYNVAAREFLARG
jgi:pimeloyl-ACP methyl ester carboxylesterase